MAATWNEIQTTLRDAWKDANERGDKDLADRLDKAMHGVAEKQNELSKAHAAIRVTKAILAS